jgi:hypothetical protein
VTNIQILPQYSASYIECYLSNRKGRSKQFLGTGRCANIDHQWSMTRESSSVFSTKKAYSQTKFTPDLNRNSGMIWTVSVAFNVSVSTFGRSEKIENNRGGFYCIHWLEIYGKPWSRAISFSISIAEAINISHSMIFRHLWDLLDMKNCHLRCISQIVFIFQKAHKSFSTKISFTVFHNHHIHQISYIQTFGFSVIWILHGRDVSSKSESSFLWESMNFWKRCNYLN